MLKTQMEEIEPNKVAILIEVEREKVQAAYSNYFQRASQSVNIPGFRRGKVPRAVLIKFLGPNNIRDQITEELVQEAYPKAVKETRIHPVSEVKIQDINLKEGEAFTFKAVVEIRPKIPEFSYTGRDLTVKQVLVDDGAVENILNRLQEQFAKITPLEDGELRDNDHFSGKIEVTVEGEIDTDLSEENAYIRFNEKDPVFLPLKGIKPGETRTFSRKIEGEENKNSPRLGKTLDYSVSIQQISRPVLAELNDDFAKEVGNYESLVVLKEKIRDDLEDRFKKEAGKRAVDEVLKSISEEVNFSAPAAMVERTIDFFIENLDRQWKQYGTSMEEYLGKSGKGLAEFRDSFREKAIVETKITLIIDEISQKEQIEVMDSEYRAEVEKRARDYNMPVDRLLSALSGAKGEETIKSSIQRDKVNDFLLKNNGIRYDMVKDLENNKGETQGDAGTHSN